MDHKVRISSLDGFRAVAVGIVILSHLSMTHSLYQPINNFVSTVFFGKIGVKIFFVLSGFLITFHLLREQILSSRISLPAFYLRRVLRIFPAFYFYLVVLALLNGLYDLNIHSLAFLSAFLFIHNFSPWGSHWFLNHAWTLGVEEQFYLIWPAMLVIAKNLKFLNLWLIMLCLGTFMRSLHYKYPGTAEFMLADFLMHADYLFSGCFMGYLYQYRREELVRRFQGIAPVFVYLAIAMIWICCVLEFHPVYDKITVPIAGTMINLCISFLILYFVLKEHNIGFRVLNSRAFTFVGKLSYSLYLWQQLFINPVANWFSSVWLGLASLFCVSLFSHYVIEAPFLRLKDKLPSRILKTGDIRTSHIGTPRGS